MASVQEDLEAAHACLARAAGSVSLALQRRRVAIEDVTTATQAAADAQGYLAEVRRKMIDRARQR